MKRKYAILTAILVTTGSLVALAEKQASKTTLYLLKAGGETIAELRVRGTATVEVSAADSNGRVNYDVGTETIVATGGAILKVGSGPNTISVRADEIES